MDERRRRNARPGQGLDEEKLDLPKPEVDTVRPPAEGGEDAYSAQTVVKAVPRDLLNNIALRPAKVPSFGAHGLSPEKKKDEPAPIETNESEPDTADEDAVAAASTAAGAALERESDADPETAGAAPTEEAAPEEASGSWIWLALAIVSGVAAAVIWSECGR